MLCDTYNTWCALIEHCWMTDWLFCVCSMLEYVHNLRKKISSLQGDGFDSKMSVDDYHRLINIQKVRVVFLPKCLISCELVTDIICCLVFICELDNVMACVMLFQLGVQRSEAALRAKEEQLVEDMK